MIKALLIFSKILIIGIDFLALIVYTRKDITVHKDISMSLLIINATVLLAEIVYRLVE